MSFGRRIALLSALAVAAAIIVVAGAAWLIVRSELRGEIDDSLRRQAQSAQQFAANGPLGGGPLPPTAAGGPAMGSATGGMPDERLRAILHRRLEQRAGSSGRTAAGGDGHGPPALPPEILGGPGIETGSAIGQLVDSQGNVLLASPGFESGQTLPTGTATDVLRSGSDAIELSDTTVDGSSVRLATARLNDNAALVLARPLSEVNNSLSQLALILVLVAIGGTAAAAGLGLLVARTAMAPVRTLTGTAEDVARTEDLTQRIEVAGDDELARLGLAFNSMLAALERSVGAQRRLVADASHELRTPLTSLRTNIETLMRGGGSSEEERAQLLDELDEELQEMGRLVDDIVDLAREGAEKGIGAEPADVRLDEVAAACVDRTRRRIAEGTVIEAELEPTIVRGAPERLDRAIGNLLDNAVKWTPAGGRIEVRVNRHGVRVDDSGPGIDDADLPHVFERFWRSPAARGTPGSGLGLAIVKQVAETHGGAVTASRSELGGARFDLALPGSPLDS